MENAEVFVGPRHIESQGIVLRFGQRHHSIPYRTRVEIVSSIVNLTSGRLYYQGIQDKFWRFSLLRLYQDKLRFFAT